MQTWTFGGICDVSSVVCKSPTVFDSDFGNVIDTCFLEFFVGRMFLHRCDALAIDDTTG